MLSIVRSILFFGIYPSILSPGGGKELLKNFYVFLLDIFGNLLTKGLKCAILNCACKMKW